MKTVRFLTALVFASVLNAESSKPAGKTADELWTDIVGRESPAPVNGTGKASPNERALRQADRVRGKAALAKEFYTQFPEHPKAREARKTEAVFTLRSVVVGDTAQEDAAYAVAKRFRDDKTNGLSDRFEVALAMDRLALTSKIKARQTENRCSEWMKLADNLRTEFGPLPELSRYYLEIARGADMDTARAIAKALLADQVGPDLTQQAQAILARDALLGQPANLTLSSIDGSTVELGHSNPSPALLLIWSPTDLEGARAFERYRESLANSPCIFLALDATLAEAGNVAAALPGVRVYAAPGAASRSLREALKVVRQPCVYAIDAKGVISGFGPLTEIPGLAASLTAPAN